MLIPPAECIVVKLAVIIPKSENVTMLKYLGIQSIKCKILIFLFRTFRCGFVTPLVRNYKCRNTKFLQKYNIADNNRQA